MDKYEYNLKLGEIKKLVTGGNYEDAAKIADTIEWKRVRNTRTLCMVSEIYEANGRLEDSKEILLRAYRRSQMTRTVLFRLTEVAIKMKEFDEAVEYYSEFVNAAPNDTSRYILKYEIYKGRGSSLEDQIAILEEYKEVEYTEQWGYELAKLYYQAGDKKKCIESCDDLVLWFRQGKYVIKALELKKSLTELTPVQQAIYDHREENLMPIKERVEAAVPELEKIIVDKMPSNETDAITENIISETQRELAQAVSLHAAEVTREPQDQSWRYNTAEKTRMIPTEEVKDNVSAADGRTSAMRGNVDERNSAMGGNGSETDSFMDGSVNGMNSSVGGNGIDSPIRGNEGGMNPAAGDTNISADSQPNSVPDLDTLQLQRELAESMREIISGISHTETEGEIVEPKNDMSFFKDSDISNLASERQSSTSIDDILVSMSGADDVAATEEPDAEENALPAADQLTREEETRTSEGEMPGNASQSAASVPQGRVSDPSMGTIRRNRVGKNQAAAQAGKEMTNGAAALEAQAAKLRAEADQAAGMNADLAAKAKASAAAKENAIRQAQNGAYPGTAGNRPDSAAASQPTAGSRPEPITASQSGAGSQPTAGNRPDPAGVSQAAAGNRPDPDGVSQAAAGNRSETIAAGRSAVGNRPESSVNQPMTGAYSGTSGQSVSSTSQNPYQQAAYQPHQSLTLSQQQLFSYFSTIQGLQEQIASALSESIIKVKKDKTSRSGNLVITGDPGSGRTTLGIRFAKALSLERGVPAARVAKIYAEDLNKKDIASTVAKIAGGTLIVEEAGDLSEEVVAQLSKAMEFRTDGLLVILEDEKTYLKELFDHNPSFAEKFTSEISIPIMTNDELVTFGKIYAYDEDYRIDDSAMLALYNRISEMQTPEHPVCIADVRDIVDEAIHRSERTGIRKLGMILSHKRYDEEDRVILYEKDFK